MMDRDLFLAILAMDSYNRGYGQGIKDLPASGSIGNATIQFDSLVLGGIGDNRDDAAAGFYAIAYDVSDVSGLAGYSRVISYRGTDGVSDIINGWDAVAGFAGSSQAQLAKQFYQSVTGKNPYQGYEQRVYLTGHSLGGALAGFVSSLNGSSATGFDHAPFGVAAQADLVLEARSRNGGEFPDSFASVGLSDPQTSVLKGIYLEGEVNAQLRNGGIQATLGTLISAPVFLVNPRLGQLLLNELLDLATSTAALEQGVAKTELSTYDADFPNLPLGAALNRHSISQLIIRLFGDDQWQSEGGGADWKESYKYVVPALFDTGLAQFVGASSNDGTYDPSEALQAMIAYSAISEGTTVFGNSAIRALYSDLDDLGKFIANTGTKPGAISSEVFDLIGSIIVNFAGILAVKKTDSVIGNLAPSTPLNGILRYSIATDSLSIDISDDRWTIFGSATEPVQPSEILERDNLIDNLISNSFKNTGNLKGLDTLHAALNWYAEDSGYDLIDSITFDVEGAAGFVPIAPGDGDLQLIFSAIGRGADADVEAAGDLSQIIVASGFNETIKGGKGRDILLSALNGATLSGGPDDDWLLGGIGQDTIWGGDIGNDLGKNDGDDTVDYSVIGKADNKKVPIYVSFNGAPDKTQITVTGGQSVGVDTLYSIEKIIGSEGIDTFKVASGFLKPDLDLTFDANGGQGGSKLDMISLKKLQDGGATVFLRQDGNGSVAGKSGGKITLVGFHTQIIGSDFDDEITDLSDGSEKIIDGGDGDDVLTADNGPALLIGGEGNDTLIGGSGNDTLIGDRGANSYVGGAGADLIIADRADSSGFPAISVGGGEGSDYIIIGFSQDSSDNGLIEIYGAEGDDVIEYIPSAAPARIGLSIEAGSGADILDLAGAEAYVTITTEYGIADLSFTWAGASTLVDEDANSRYYEFFGDVVIQSAAAESSITIRNTHLFYGFNKYFGIYDTYYAENISIISYEDGVNLPYVHNGDSYGIEDDLTFNLGTIAPQFYRAYESYATERNGAPAAPSALRAASFAITSKAGGSAPVKSSALSGGLALLSGENTEVGTDDDDIFVLTPGDIQIDGLLGNDVLTVAGERENYEFSVDGDVIYVRDKRGLFGSRELINFEGIYLSDEDRTYSISEIADELAVGDGVAIHGQDEMDDSLAGSDGHDVINGLGGNDILDGGKGNDRINGGEGNDELIGGLGNDFLDGGAGEDLLRGGRGDDRYIVDDATDVVIENQDEGIDAVYASVDYVLGANIERLYLSGSAQTGTGNEGDNELFGAEYVDSNLYGLAGNDALHGNEGNDSLYGGDGDDLLVGQGGDDLLVGGAGSDYLAGGDGNDVLEGGDGNDALQGGTGADALTGGLGDDKYYVDDIQAQVIELSDQGEDTVYSSIDYALNDNVENLTLLAQTIFGAGNSLDNVIFGNDADNILLGIDGNDQLIGGAGSDTLIGYTGDDTIIGGGGDNTIDTAVFIGARQEYRIVSDGRGKLVIIDQVAGRDGTDTVTETEQARFLQDDEMQQYLDLTAYYTNATPVVSEQLGDFDSEEGSLVEIALPDNLFSDPEGSALSFSATLSSGDALPSWLSFDGSSFAGTAPDGLLGPIGVTVAASDGLTFASQDFDITIIPVADIGSANLFGGTSISQNFVGPVEKTYVQVAQKNNHIVNEIVVEDDFLFRGVRVMRSPNLFHERQLMQLRNPVSLATELATAISQFDRGQGMLALSVQTSNEIDPHLGFTVAGLRDRGMHLQIN